MYAVVGTGAVGATVGARLARNGHSVLFCDVDREHVAAMNRHGLAFEGAGDEFSLPVTAVVPDDLPDRLGIVLLAVRAYDTSSALRHIVPRLEPSGVVVSLQDGFGARAIQAALGPTRALGALVTVEATYRGPGRIFIGERGSVRVGRLDGQVTERLAHIADDLEAEVTGRLMGSLWAKQAYNAILFAVSLSDLPTADALAEPRYAATYTRLAEEVLSATSIRPEPFDGFDPAKVPESIQRWVERKRHSALIRSETYLDLAVRRRRTERDLFDGITGPLLDRMLALTVAIEERRRVCKVANLELLAAFEGCLTKGSQLNAVITTLQPAAHPKHDGGPLAGAPIAIKDNIDVEGVVTTNASIVGRPPPAARDATVVHRLRVAGAELLCKTNLLEYAAGSVSPAFGMTFNPRDPSRTSGGSSGGSAALVAAGVCDHALGTDTGGSIRVPAAYCGVVGLKPTAGLVPLEGVFPLAPTLDQVGPLTRTVPGAAALLAAITARSYELRVVRGGRVGVLRQQLDDPALEPGIRSCVETALARLEEAGFELADVDIAELELVDHALEVIVIKEAFAIHRSLLEREGGRYGSGTRALIELGRELNEAEYAQALLVKEDVAAAFARVFKRVDVLAGPTVAYVAPHEDPPVGTAEGTVEGRFTGPYSLAGVPAVSVPCGLAEGDLPAGLQLAAASGADEHLLAVAATYELISQEPAGAWK